MAATTLMSFAEFERLDQGADHIELLEGELIRVPPAKRRHNLVAHRLQQALREALEKIRAANLSAALGEANHEMGYYLTRDPASWLQPDVSVTHPNQHGEDYFEGAPLLVFEIVSEWDTAQHLNGKVAAYLAHGAAEVWLIYPDKREAWVFAPGANVRIETKSIHAAVLPAVEIPFDRIFNA